MVKLSAAFHHNTGHLPCDQLIVAYQKVGLGIGQRVAHIHQAKDLSIISTLSFSIARVEYNIPNTTRSMTTELNALKSF